MGVPIAAIPLATIVNPKIILREPALDVIGKFRLLSLTFKVVSKLTVEVDADFY